MYMVCWSSTVNSRPYKIICIHTLIQDCWVVCWKQTIFLMILFPIWGFYYLVFTKFSLGKVTIIIHGILKYPGYLEDDKGSFLWGSHHILTYCKIQIQVPCKRVRLDVINYVLPKHVHMSPCEWLQPQKKLTWRLIEAKMCPIRPKLHEWKSFSRGNHHSLVEKGKWLPHEGKGNLDDSSTLFGST